MRKVDGGKRKTKKMNKGLNGQTVGSADFLLLKLMWATTLSPIGSVPEGGWSGERDRREGGVEGEKNKR